MQSKKITDILSHSIRGIRARRSERRLQQARELAPALAAVSPDIVQIRAFGSVVRNKARWRSDTDIAWITVGTDSLSLEEVFRLEDRMRDVVEARRLTLGERGRRAIHLQYVPEGALYEPRKYGKNDWANEVLESIQRESIVLFKKNKE